MRLLWPFTVSALLFASGACVYSFFVLYYRSLGFSGAQIGVLTGVTPLITLISSPLWTNLADRTRRHRLVMSILIVAAAAVMFSIPAARTFAPMFALAVLYNVIAAPLFSFLDNATMAMLGSDRALYGRVRLGGTLGFGLTGVVVGSLVDRYGLHTAFWLSGSLLLVAFVAAQALNHDRPREAGVKVGKVTDLLADRRWLPFLLIAFAGGLATSVSNTYLFPYLQELGASETTMGLALTIGTIAEVPIFFFGNRLLRRIRPFNLLLLAMALTGTRLLLFFVWGSPNFVLFLQFLNGLAFPVMWLAGVAYADENAPPGMGATAQGLFGAFVFGFGSAVGNFAAGPLLASLGGRGMYLVFGLVVLAIVGVVAVMPRRVPAQEAVPS